MTLIKTSLLNAIAVAVRMLTMLGLNKILAIYIGPAGYVPPLATFRMPCR